MLYISLIPFFAAADRAIGGAWRRSYSVAAVLAVAIASWLIGEKLASVMCLAWLIWRTPAWKIGGSTTPRKAAEIAASFVRHLVPASAALVASTWFPVGLAPISMTAFALVATGLAVYYTNEVDRLAKSGSSEDGRINERVELLRGAAYGICVAIGHITTGS